MASADGLALRTGFALRAFFGFKGQTKLLLGAILLWLFGGGLGLAVDQQAEWLAWLRGKDSFMSITNWLEAHMGWLLSLREIFYLGAALALCVLVWRGSQLLRLVSRGAGLLRSELAARRRELDDLIAFQTRRVEALAAEMHVLSRRAAEADRRAGDARAGSSMLDEPSPFATDTATERARSFTAAAGTMISRTGQTSPGKSGRGPLRIVIAIDHLDSLPASRGCDILSHAAVMFKQGFVVVAAADPARLATFGEKAPDLEKWVQVPFQLGELASRGNYAQLAGLILGGEKAPEPHSRDATASALDQPVSSAEEQLLLGLASFAGRSARALKRFVNLYRLARIPNQIHKGALAFMLALDAGGTQAEIAAVNDALSRPGPDGILELPNPGVRLAEALAVAQSVLGQFSVNDARRAAAAARLFSFHIRNCGQS